MLVFIGRVVDSFAGVAVVVDDGKYFDEFSGAADSPVSGWMSVADVDVEAVDVVVAVTESGVAETDEFNDGIVIVSLLIPVSSMKHLKRTLSSNISPNL